MSRDISELLRDATPVQAIAPDLDTIEETAMQRRAVKGGLGIAAIVAVGALATTTLPDSQDPPPIIDAPPTEIVETPVDSSEPEPIILGADQRLIEPGPVLIDLDTHLQLSTGLFATMEAPPQWQGFLGYTLMEVTTMHGSDSDMRQVAVWNVTALPPDPCRWQAQGEQNRITAGSTAEELARQFFDLRTDATEPVPTSLAGYEGWYVEIDVPEDLSFADCDMEQDSPRYMAFYIQEGLQRYHQAPGQSHRLWVLDVNGQPLVVEASWTSNNTPAEVDEVLAVVQTLRFGPPPS